MSTTKKQTAVAVAAASSLKTLKDFTTKSAYIRYLSSENLSRAQIVKRFHEVDKAAMIYQHVNNVLTNDKMKRALAK